MKTVVVAKARSKTSAAPIAISIPRFLVPAEALRPVTATSRVADMRPILLQLFRAASVTEGWFALRVPEPLFLHAIDSRRAAARKMRASPCENEFKQIDASE
jgi:hypothetical protein